MDIVPFALRRSEAKQDLRIRSLAEAAGAGDRTRNRPLPLPGMPCRGAQPLWRMPESRLAAGSGPHARLRRCGRHDPVPGRGTGWGTRSSSAEGLGAPTDGALHRETGRMRRKQEGGHGSLRVVKSPSPDRRDFCVRAARGRSPGQGRRPAKGGVTVSSRPGQSAEAPSWDMRQPAAIRSGTSVRVVPPQRGATSEGMLPAGRR